MIIGIEGFLGDGKTIYMVRCAKIDFNNNRKIYSNIKLFGIKYYNLVIEDFLNKEESNKFKNCTMLIDEITLFMDCRRSHRKENIALSTLLRQSRKRSIDIYYTCQSLDETDLRLIRYTSVFVIAQRCYTKLNSGEIIEIENYRQYIIIDSRKRKENLTRINMEISQYYNSYDTDEIIESIYQEKKNDNRKTI